MELGPVNASGQRRFTRVGPNSVATRANPKRIWAKHDDAEVVPLVCRIGNQKRIKVQWLIWGLG